MTDVELVYGACRGRITDLGDGDPEPYVARFSADGPAEPLPT